MVRLKSGGWLLREPHGATDFAEGLECVRLADGFQGSSSVRIALSSRRLLCNERVNHLPVHICQPTISAVVAEGELGMVDAEQVKNGGMDVVTVSGMFCGFVRPFVGAAV